MVEPTKILLIQSNPLLSIIIFYQVEYGRKSEINVVLLMSKKISNLNVYNCSRANK